MLNFKLIKTRFAPSPTGYIHFGNIRTAFFCWLFSKKYNGNFLLRIDDTDEKRYLKKYVNNIIDVLKWLNLDYDDIFFQSSRYDLYESYLKKLIYLGKAYKCYCTKERLISLKNLQIINKERVMYDGFCSFLKTNSNKDFVIRFKSDRFGFTEFKDLVKGVIKISNNEVDDFIISKKYKPTYNFASVIDDIEFNITHIIRGEDHVSNTQKQIMLIKAFGFSLPIFSHLPIILDSNKNKLSKRDNSLYLDYYKSNGFLPIAILNYLIRLGWSNKDQEFFSLLEMINLFDIKNVNKSPSSFDINKLLWLNKYYMHKTSVENLLISVNYVLKKFKIKFFFGFNFNSFLSLNKNRYCNLFQIFNDNLYFYSNSFFEINLLNKNYLCYIKSYFFDIKKSVFIWNISNIKSHFEFFVNENKLVFSDFSILIRNLITGKIFSNSLYDIIYLCGKILLLKKIANNIKQMGL